MNFREKKKLLIQIKGQFRLLNSWRINLVNRKDTSDGEGGVWIDDMVGRNATMFAASDIESEADETLFHECLHVCLAEINNNEGRRKRAAEEIFVHDLTRLMYEGRHDVQDMKSTDSWINDFEEMELWG